MQRIAYAARISLIDEHTGLTIPRRGEGEPERVDILLPEGAAAKYHDLSTLANGINKAEKRRDSCTGYEFVFALDPRLTVNERWEQISSFVQEHLVSKGVPVFIALHGPKNPHAHVVAGTRPLGPKGWAEKKARDLVPDFVKSQGRPFIARHEHWGKLWGQFQDEWFARHGKSIRVDPLLPIHRKHLGPKRFQNALSSKIQEDARIREINATLANTHKQQMGFSRGYNRGILDTQQALKDRLTRTSHVDHQVSAPKLRSLTLEAVARDISPEYAKLRDQARQQQALVYKMKGGRQRLADEVEKDTANLSEQEQRLGQPRFLLHRIGRWAEEQKHNVKRKHRGPLRIIATLQHPETKAIEERLNARSWVHDQRWSIDLKTALDRLENLNRQAEARLEELRSTAEAELQRRRQKFASGRQQEQNIPKQTPRHGLKI